MYKDLHRFMYRTKTFILLFSPLVDMKFNSLILPKIKEEIHVRAYL